MTDPPPYPGAPRWVKVFGIIAFVVILLFVILLFTRGHGPGRHTSLDGSDGQTPPSSGTYHRPPGQLGGDTPPASAPG